MKINNIKKKIIVVFLVMFISVICELFIFNYKSYTINKENKGVHVVYDKSNQNSTDEGKIKLDLKGQYVKKIKIKYSVKTDQYVLIKLIGRDFYNSKNKIELNEKFDNEVHYQYVNVNCNINSVVFKYDKSSKLIIDKIFIDNTFKINGLRMFLLITSFSLISFLVIFFKNKITNNMLYKYFFVVGMFMGVLLIVLQPASTFYSWDDQVHFKEVYELGGGTKNWNIGEYEMIDDFAVGRDSISSIEEQRNLNKYLNRSAYSNYSTKPGRFITYNKVAYIPLSLGYNLCKLLNVPFSISFKMTKIINLVLYLMLMSFAIKKAKIGKRLIACIGLLPSSIFLACQYSYDPAVISGLTIALVYLINWICDKDSKVTFSNLLIFLITILYACFTKAVYIPIIGLFIFIPHDRFKNKKEEYWIKGFVLIICLFVLYTFAMPSSLMSTVGGDSRGGLTSVAGQFKLILTHPFGYIKVLRDTFILQFNAKLFGIQTFGGFAYIGNISQNIYILLLFIIVFVTITDTNKYIINFSNRLLILFDIFIIILFIWTALYLSFTPVGLNTINGVQCRYFIPLLYPLLICMQSNKIKTNLSEEKYNIILLILMFLIFIITIYNLVLLRFCL